MIRCMQADVAVLTDQSWQEPDLLLSTELSPVGTAEKLLRNVVAQPVQGPSHYLDVPGTQTCFLVQFPVHGLKRGFPTIDTPLRKLQW